MTPWSELRGHRIFLTGGTGFFGRSLLSDFVERNARSPLGVELVVLSRDPEGFRSRWPDFSRDRSVSFHLGDIRDFTFPHGEFSLILHAATPASTLADRENAEMMRATITAGTRRVLEFAALCRAKRLLFVSSGAVYGPQPAELVCLPETYIAAPGQEISAYGEAKGYGEALCLDASETTELQVIIARCFAFVGPHLPLNADYAIGNFIRDALAGGPIRVRGDGTPLRSYLESSDLVTWLWTLLIRGQNRRAYNVGAEAPISIAELARKVAALAEPPLEVHLSQIPVPDKVPERYVPSIARIRDELGLAPQVSLDEALQRTWAWHRGSRNGAR